MTDIAPASAPAPVAPAQPAERPAFNHPLIPPLRAPGKAPAAPAQAQPGDAQPEPGAPPVEAKAEQEAKADAGPEQVEYLPDDEFTITVDGRELPVTLGKLIASYQRNEAANTRFTEAKALKHEAVELVKGLRTPEGLVATLKRIGVDAYELADRLVVERYEFEQMTPEQRAQAQYQRERAEWERQKAQSAQQQAQQQQAAQAQAFQTQFIAQATSTMDRLAVPANPALRSEIIARAAAQFRADIAGGYETTPMAAVQEAWTDYQTRLDEHARALPVDRRVSDEERAQLAAQAQANRVRVAQAAPRASVAQPRAEDGRFAPVRKPTFDPFNPMQRR